MSSTKTATKVTRPTVTDEEYVELLAIRLAAMKGFEAGTVTEEEKSAARRGVRMARRIRKAEADLLVAFREAEAQKGAARKVAARKSAQTRAARKVETADSVTE